MSRAQWIGNNSREIGNHAQLEPRRASRGKGGEHAPPPQAHLFEVSVRLDEGHGGGAACGVGHAARAQAGRGLLGKGGRGRRMSARRSSLLCSGRCACQYRGSDCSRVIPLLTRGCMGVFMVAAPRKAGRPAKQNVSVRQMSSPREISAVQCAAG